MRYHTLTSRAALFAAVTLTSCSLVSLLHAQQQGAGNVNNGVDSFIGSGQTNLISSGTAGAFIGAGRSNTITAGSFFTAISTGFNNLAAQSQYGFIGGGFGNVMEETSRFGFIGGGVLVRAAAASTSIP